LREVKKVIYCAAYKLKILRVGAEKTYCQKVHEQSLEIEDRQYIYEPHFHISFTLRK